LPARTVAADSNNAPGVPAAKIPATINAPKTTQIATTLLTLVCAPRRGRFAAGRERDEGTLFTVPLLRASCITRR
jgi:hypothetical protein